MSLTTDNDAYLLTGQDRYYTNGLFINFHHAIRQTDSTSSKRIWGAQVGQQIFNAQQGNIINPNDIDRPITGYLFAKAGYKWVFKNEQSLETSFDIGMMGPDAFGQEAQKLIHDTFNFYRVTGWQYQLKNSFETNASLRYAGLLGRSDETADFIYDTKATLGTTFTGAEVGITLRLGTLAPLFQSVLDNNRISNKPGKSARNECFFYTRPSLKYVLYDGTIQGGLLIDDKGPYTFEPKRLVYLHEIGMKAAGSRWSFDFHLVFKTREVVRQVRSHQFGSISLAYRFGR